MNLALTDPLCSERSPCALIQRKQRGARAAGHKEEKQCLLGNWQGKVEERRRVIEAQLHPPSWLVTLITALIEVNRPIKGCGGADKHWRAWPVLPGFWHS